MKRPFLFLIMAMLLIPTKSLVADGVIGEQKVSQADRDKRMQWWREARFGMFVHWGLYSIPAGQWGERKWKKGGVEWIQQRAGVPADVYEKELIPQFNPNLILRRSGPASRKRQAADISYSPVNTMRGLPYTTAS